MKNLRKIIKYIKFIFWPWRITSSHQFSHAMPKGFPRENSILPEFKATTDDIKITSRILIAFKKAQEEEIKLGFNKSVDMWDIIRENHLSEFQDLLEKDNIEEIANYLCNMHRQGIVHGITQGESEFKNLSNKKNYYFAITFIKDKLVSLAEALGVLPLEDPAQGISGENIYLDSGNLIRKINEKMGISIVFPEIDGGFLKMKTPEGNICFRDLSSVYVAWRIKNLIPNNEAKICEIGGGTAKTGTYLSRFKFKNYTLYDLPYVNIIQAFSLIKSCPDIDVSLYGESEKGFKILPYWKFFDDNERYDLIFNIDSFPEIDQDIVVKYLDKISTVSKLFLTINQESRGSLLVDKKIQNVVSQLIEKMTKFERVYRFLFWMRNGYVEELYKVCES